MKYHLWLDAALYVIVFLLIQFLTSMAVMYFFPDFQVNVTALTLAAAVSSVVIVATFAALRWSPFSRLYLQSRPWTALCWVAVLTVGTVIPSIWLSEQLGLDLSDEQKQMMTRLMSTPWGYLAVGIAVPLAEEMVFRGALLRTLLKVFSSEETPRWRPWMAIILSALLFAAVHGNLAQGIHAFLMGLLLGWMYWRTDSIVPGLTLHWVNNSIAYALERIFPGIDDVRLVDLCGGSQLRVLMYVGFSLLIFFPALYQLCLRLRKK